MIYNELSKVNVISFTTGYDTYGQPRQEIDSVREVEMYIKVQFQNNVSDVRYVDATHIGLTMDKLITTQNQIEADGVKYNVLYTIPSHRWQTIMLKKVS